MRRGRLQKKLKRAVVDNTSKAYGLPLPGRRRRARYSSIPEIRKEKHHRTRRQIVDFIRKKANVTAI